MASLTTPLTDLLPRATAPRDVAVTFGRHDGSVKATRAATARPPTLCGVCDGVPPPLVLTHVRIPSIQAHRLVRAGLVEAAICGLGAAAGREVPLADYRSRAGRHALRRLAPLIDPVMSLACRIPAGGSSFGLADEVDFVRLWMRA